MELKKKLLTAGEIVAFSSCCLALLYRSLYADSVASLVGGHEARSVIEHFGSGIAWPLMLDLLFVADDYLNGNKIENGKKANIVECGTAFLSYLTLISFHEGLSALVTPRPFQIDQYAFGLVGLGIGTLIIWEKNKRMEKK